MFDKTILAKADTNPPPLRRCVTLTASSNQQNIIFPAKLSVEQTSSEIAADYKSKLLNVNSLIDITGGFGVDVFYFAKQINKVIYVEKQTSNQGSLTSSYKQNIHKV